MIEDLYKQSLEAAASAVGIFERLDSVLEALESFQKTLAPLESTELGVHLTSLKSVLALFETEEHIEHLAPTSHLSKIPSKIERLNLGGSIIKARSQGETYQQISDKLGISASSISVFIKTYDNLKSARDKSRYQRVSIFDSYTQYEDLGAILYRQLARLEADPESHAKYITELRHTIKEAAAWMQAMQNAKRAEQRELELKEKIRDIFLKCAPEQREEILKLFNAGNIDLYRLAT